jgi:biotin transport system substrate-specific component
MQASLTLGDALVPRKTLLRDTLLVLGASLFIAAMARTALPVPLSPVPVTGQTFAVLLVGVILGSRLGSFSVLAYIAEGAAGLPVFAGGGGFAFLLGPTGGYLAGFAAAAFVTGWLAEHGWDRRPLTAALAMLTGNAVLYLFGLLWLSRFTGMESVLALGLYPFLAGDLIKIGLATAALPLAWKMIRRG